MDSSNQFTGDLTTGLHSSTPARALEVKGEREDDVLSELIEAMASDKSTVPVRTHPHGAARA